MPLGAGSSPVTYATTKLTYPIFDVEFDPYNRGYLIVGGGGGENRTGVPNRLTLLDVSERHEVVQVAEADLSVEEDSPQTLCSLTTKQGLITIAGISSSSADQKAQKNEHLRSFDVEFPPRKRAKRDPEANDNVPEAKAARITPAGKSQLFRPNPASFRNPRTYQRLMRLSPVKSRDVAAKRIGAIGTADAAQNEIVLFDATIFIPRPSSVLQRLELQSEAEDLDLFEYSEGCFGLVYCTSYEVYLYRLDCDFARKSSTPVDDEPVSIYSTSKRGTAARPKMRCIRWISPDHVVVLQNTQPDGVPELLILRIDAASSTSTLISRKSLPKSLGMGIRLAICLLDADPASGERQIAIAVAGQNKSIHIYTTNHKPASTSQIEQFAPLSSFSVVDTSSQHPQSISKIAFSNFFPPRQGDSTTSVAASTQYIQLASVSVGWTVSVETLALTSTPTAPHLTQDDPIAQGSTNPKSHPSVRWVLSTSQQEFVKTWAGTFVAGVVVLVIALLAQSLISARRGDTTGGLGIGVPAPASPLFSSLSDYAGQATGSVASIATPQASGISEVFEDMTSTVSAAAAEASASAGHGIHGLRDLLHLHREQLVPDNPYAAASKSKAILLNAPGLGKESDGSDITAKMHEGEATVEELKAKGAKRFDELSGHEKEQWTKWLKETGQWTEEQGVSMLKSVLFSQWAEIVGGGIRDAVLH